MGINVKVQKSPKQREIITAQAKVARDLRSCMRCRFFHGNNRQCIVKKCVKEETKKPEITAEDKKNKCYECPYPHTEGYCFPCMKEIVEGIRKPIAMTMEEKEDG